MILYCCNEKPHNITFALEKFMQSLLMLPEYSDWPYLVESWLVDWSSCESILNCDRPLYPSSPESKLCMFYKFWKHHLCGPYLYLGIEPNYPHGELVSHLPCQESEWRHFSGAYHTFHVPKNNVKWLWCPKEVRLKEMTSKTVGGLFFTIDLVAVHRHLYTDQFNFSV